MKMLTKSDETSFQMASSHRVRNTLCVSLRAGAPVAISFVRYSHHLYSGFGMPYLWFSTSWRHNLQISQRNVDQIFPGIDFSRSVEVLNPFRRGLSVLVVNSNEALPSQARGGIWQGRRGIRHRISRLIYHPTDRLLRLICRIFPGKT